MLVFDSKMNNNAKLLGRFLDLSETLYVIISCPRREVLYFD